VVREHEECARHNNKSKKTRAERSRKMGMILREDRLDWFELKRSERQKE